MIVGWIVCAALLLLGRALGATLLVGFLCSFAFGATAVLPAGGSTMPASVAMTALVLISILFGRRSWVGDLAEIFRQQPLAHLVLFLTLYAVASAYFMPRLFAGDVSVFVPLKGLVTKVPVGPVSGNFNQSSYFIFNCLAFFAIAILLKRGQVRELRTAFLAWCSVNAALGLIDFAGKSAGLGDLLEPLRTAGYSMLADDVAAGFVRITGAFPEASSFASTAALPCLAFSFTDWVLTRSRLSMVLAVILATLLMLSTSSTGYGGLALSLAVYGLVAGISLLRGRLLVQHAILMVCIWAAITVLLGLYLYDEHFLDAMIQMLKSATVNKSTSDSALERGSWNAQSIRNFMDTYGIGVGLGSTRSSSWPLSVLAQLGVMGAITFGVAIAMLASSLFRSKEGELACVAACASAAALSGLAASIFGGSGADPGMIFFIALALISASLAAGQAVSPKMIQTDAAGGIEVYTCAYDEHRLIEH